MALVKRGEIGDAKINPLVLSITHINHHTLQDASRPPHDRAHPTFAGRNIDHVRHILVAKQRATTLDNIPFGNQHLRFQPNIIGPNNGHAARTGGVVYMLFRRTGYWKVKTLLEREIWHKAPHFVAPHTRGAG